MGRGSGTQAIERGGSRLLYGATGPRRSRRRGLAKQYWIMGDRDHQVVPITDELLQFLDDTDQGMQAEKLRSPIVQTRLTNGGELMFKVESIDNAQMCNVDGTTKLLFTDNSRLRLIHPAFRNDPARPAEKGISIPPSLSKLKQVPGNAEVEVIEEDY